MGLRALRKRLRKWARRCVAVLVLLAYTTTALGLPLPLPTANGSTDSTKAAPCQQAKKCCCSSGDGVGHCCCCCTPAKQSDNEEPSNDNSPQSSGSPSKPPVKKPTDSSAKTSQGSVLFVKARTCCWGDDLNGIILTPALPPPPFLYWTFDWKLAGGVWTVDSSAVSLRTTPPVPPPREQF
jgi:hypothetical protein